MSVLHLGNLYVPGVNFIRFKLYNQKATIDDKFQLVSFWHVRYLDSD